MRGVFCHHRGPWTAEGNAAASPCCKLTQLFSTVSDRQEAYYASYCNQSKCRRGFTDTAALNYKKKKTNKQKKQGWQQQQSLVLVFSSTCKHLTASLDRATGENKWSRELLDLSLIAWEHSKFHYLGHLSPMHLLFSPFLLSSFLFAHLRCNT